MAESKGDMFPDVITRNIIKGKCSGKCEFCYMRHGNLAKIEAYHKPYHLVNSELKKKFKPDTVYFIGSATDMWSPDVKSCDISAVLRRLHESDVPSSTWFLFSTKYPDGYAKYLDSFPDNTILSITLETVGNFRYLQISPGTMRTGARVESFTRIKHRIETKGYLYKLMVNMEPAIDFDHAIMMNSLGNISPDLMVFGADTSGWLKKNGFAEPTWTDMARLIEASRPYCGQVLVKKNIWRLAHKSQRGAFLKTMRGLAHNLDIAIQGDPTCSKKQFFLTEIVL